MDILPIPQYIPVSDAKILEDPPTELKRGLCPPLFKGRTLAQEGFPDLSKVSVG
jgi:hypothetical protein